MVVAGVVWMTDGLGDDSGLTERSFPSLSSLDSFSLSLSSFGGERIAVVMLASLPPSLGGVVEAVSVVTVSLSLFCWVGFVLEVGVLFRRFRRSLSLFLCFLLIIERLVKQADLLATVNPIN